MPIDEIIKGVMGAVDMAQKVGQAVGGVGSGTQSSSAPGSDQEPSGPTPSPDGGGDEKEEKEEKEEKKADGGGIEDIMEFSDDTPMFDGLTGGANYLMSKMGGGGAEPSMSGMEDTPGGDSPAPSQESSKSEGFEAQLKGMVKELAGNEMVQQAADAVSMSQGGPPVSDAMEQFSNKM